MTAIPPVGNAMPSVVSQATPASTAAPAAGDQLQALFEGLDFAELQSQFFAGPETLGALNAQGNATLRDYLGRLKQARAETSAFTSRVNKDESDFEAGDAGGPLHGGPAREPFKRESSTQKDMARFLEFLRLEAETAYVGKLVLLTASAMGNLIKGQ
jgi:hypothetical protein